jgi:hypothetical protein
VKSAGIEDKIKQFYLSFETIFIIITFKMAKNKKRKTIHQKDFITAKKKIGKRLNNNSTEKKEITVKPIRLITQKALLRADSSNQCLTSKKLSLNELIAQVNCFIMYYNAFHYLSCRHLIITII